VLPSVAASCKNHPDREAIGICVQCRTRVCSECVTKVDGINYCVSCLAKLAGEGKRADRESSQASEGWIAVMAAGGLILLLVLLMWGMVEATFPGSG
jgi:hypothetical protein